MPKLGGAGDRLGDNFGGLCQFAHRYHFIITNFTRLITAIPQPNNAIHRPIILSIPLFLDDSAAELAVGRGLVPAQEPGGRLTLHQENLPGADVPRRHGISPPNAVLKIESFLLLPVQQSKANIFSFF